MSLRGPVWWQERGQGTSRISATGELVFRVFGAIAHCERRLICERTRDGIAAAMRNEDLAPLPQSCEQTFR